MLFVVFAAAQVDLGNEQQRHERTPEGPAQKGSGLSLHRSGGPPIEGPRDPTTELASKRLRRELNHIVRTWPVAATQAATWRQRALLDDECSMEEYDPTGRKAVSSRDKTHRQGRPSLKRDIEADNADDPSLLNKSPDGEAEVEEAHLRAKRVEATTAPV